MRIALVATFGVKCGIATYTEHLAAELSGEHEVVVFAEDCIDNQQPDFKSDIKFIRCFNRNYVDTRLLEELEAYNPDIIHVQHEYGIFRGLKNLLNVVRDTFRGRVLMTLHTVDCNGEFDLIECADYFIVHKEEARVRLINDKGIQPEMVKVIPHGTLIVPEIPMEHARNVLELPLNRRIIISHAFLERRKNIDKIILAVAELKDEIPIQYVHIGDIHPHVLYENGQKFYNECIELIEELGVQENVRLITNFVSDEELFYYLNACDVIVTLEDDTYPKISASGIMHTVARRPVIASDVINFAEFPEGSFYRIAIDKNTLKHAIKEILLDSEVSDRFAERLFDYARKTSWDNIANAHLNLYYGCLDYTRLGYVYT